MKKAEEYITRKIKSCHNTTSIFDTNEYVRLNDAIEAIKEAQLDIVDEYYEKTKEWLSPLQRTWSDNVKAELKAKIK